MWHCDFDLCFHTGDEGHRDSLNCLHMEVVTVFTSPHIALAVASHGAPRFEGVGRNSPPEYLGHAMGIFRLTKVSQDHVRSDLTLFPS